MTNKVLLDGRSLTVNDVVAVARDYAPVALAKEALSDLQAARGVVEAAAASEQAVYGINTGFGKLANVKIDSNRVLELQRNLILSHASGLGDQLPVEIVRAVMLLKVNGLLHSESGVRPLVPTRLADMLNSGVQAVVPEQGSVGASGDLAPLAHVALALMGEGEVGGGRMAAAALQEAEIEPVVYQAKEGLALINGTQAQTAVLALLVHDALNLWHTTHGAAAMTLEALKGTPDPFDERIHLARPHPGQVESAALLRELLGDSQIRESHRTGDPRVQDAYSLRCIPQVMGAAKQTIDQAGEVAAIELNSVTDNPLVFGDEIISGGNFHGQPIAAAMDFLAIVLSSIAGMSERRIERIVNPDLSQGLPAFLAVNPGLESGFMMVQITAAALAAECRVLSTPASVQSIPTDANQEDVVPMGMTAAFKARRVFANTRRIVACELMCAAQGLDYRRPLRSSPRVESLYERVRDLVQPLTADRPLTADIERIADHIGREMLI